MSDRLFPLDDVPEVPIFREPRRVGARAPDDARFRNDYPPEWDKCTTCGGSGRRAWVEGSFVADLAVPERVGNDPCPDCLGMGSLKARVRLEAGHRCIRCKHPYIPKGDAFMLSTADKIVQRSGLHVCEECGGSGEDVVKLGPIKGFETCRECKGTGKVWTPWSVCDEHCTHRDVIRTVGGDLERHIPEYEIDAGARVSLGFEIEAAWRILTVHHFDGDKANVRWWNLGALCQRCHLLIQHKVVMERVYPFEHSEWFRPYVAAYYAWVYNDEDLTREQTMERLDELLALELAPA